jgi:anti-sigma regulatory factor (Ser/Thr protein kinase)
MSIEETILRVGKDKKVFKSGDIQRAAPDFSRGYISLLLGRMVASGRLIREGSGRWSTYAVPEFKDLLGHRIHRNLVLHGLKEHEVLDDIMRVSTLLKRVPENVQSIFNYAFSEMLNNAIDHSNSQRGEIEVLEEDSRLKFVVEDFGVGAFRSVKEKKRLASELEAIQDLLKGKTTTAPQAHSGEGIFFTSKAADLFVLESYGYRLRIDNQIEDVFVEEVPARKQGTRVTFEISTSSKRHLIKVFSKYQSNPEEPAFDRTEIQVKLYTMGTIYVSRSQARRVLTGLEKFKSVVLDYDKVPTIGQAFADEIYRVFKSKHSEIEIHSRGANEAVAFMIARVASS